jgi:hypothetical protein
VKQRNVRNLRWRRWDQWLKSRKVLVQPSKGLNRAKIHNYARKDTKWIADTRRWLERQSARDRRRRRQLIREQINADPAAWFLNRAQSMERLFFYQCERMEAKWKKPNGWYYTELRQVWRDREMVSKYYASDYYKNRRANENR